MATHRGARQKVMFRPRRLGHGNLFVGDLERSIRFYNQVCGLQEVYREPPIQAAFLSGGSSHHDVALMQVSARARVGREGHVQVPQGRGTHPGLNHFAWEMENEEELVEAYHRAKEAGVHVNRTADHQVSYSVYLFDPNGNLHEFYADAADDWRTIFRPDTTEVVTGPWNPGETAPSTKPKYVVHPEALTVPGAIFHPRRIGHCAMTTPNFQELLTFYTEVAGLELAFAPANGSFAVLSGALSGRDLTLLHTSDDHPAGLQHIGFQVADEAELNEAEALLKAAEVPLEAKIDHPTKKSIFLRDPDGIRLEFYVERPAPLSSLTEPNGYDPAYLA